MQIIFDSSTGGKDELRAFIAAIQAYNTTMWGNGTPVPQVLPHPTTHQVNAETHRGENPQLLAYAAGSRENEALREVAPDLRGVSVTPGASDVASAAQRAADTLAFQPGNVAAVVPSAVAAAASPTVPEAPQVGVPPPPNVSQAPAPAPTAPVVSAAPTTPAPGVDSTGLPWDERIHAANKGTNTDGRWRKKKGLNDAAFIGAVEAELRTRATVATSLAQHAPQFAADSGVAAAPPATVPPPPVLTDVVVPPPPVVAAVAPTTPQPPAAPPGPVAPDTSTFRGLMEWLTPLMTTGKLTFPTVTAAVQSHGLSVLSDMAQPQNAHLVPSVYSTLAASVK